MKIAILSILFFALSAHAFSQARASVDVDCKISSIYELSASFDSTKGTMAVTKRQNGEQATYFGGSFEQLNKTSLNQDLDVLAVAKAVGFSLRAANSANRYILSETANDKIELIDFINVDGVSLGVVAALGPKSFLCQ